MSKNRRKGGKFGGDHTTLIDLAAVVADIAVDLPEVTTVSPGFIKNGAGSTGGSLRVKIADATGSVLLTVRQNRSVQEIRVFTGNGQRTKLGIAKELRNRGIAIAFKKAE